MGATSKGGRRRQALVDAAAELLLEGGFDAVRHRAVAERAGVPLASTTYYFGSLEELVSAAVEHASRAELVAGRRRLDELAAQPQVAGELIELWLDLLLGARSRGGGLDAVLLRYEQLVGAGRRPYLGPLMRSLRPQLDELLTEILALTDRAVDRDELYRLVALVDGTVVSALIEAEPDPRAAARQMLLSALRAGD